MGTAHPGKGCGHGNKYGASWATPSPTDKLRKRVKQDALLSETVVEFSTRASCEGKVALGGDAHGLLVPSGILWPVALG